MDFGMNDNNHSNDDLMISIDNDIMFSDDPFPTLPGFPPVKSSPENSRDNKFVKKPSVSTSSSSSSSALPWSNLSKPNPTQESSMHPDPVASEPGSDNLNQEEADLFENIDLWDGSNGFDASFLFADDSEANNVQEQAHQTENNDEVHNYGTVPEANPNQSDQELSNFFLEWLKNNRDTIAPEDLKKIKLKTSTIQRAAARLGGGKEGKMQLLKLILTWVQNHHLQKKKRRVGDQVLPNCPTWLENNNGTPSNYDQYNNMQGAPMVVPYSNPYYQMDFNNAFSPPPPVMYTPYPMGTSLPHMHYGGFGSMYSMFPGVAGSSSATKEARKKRMARQKRLSTLHHHKGSAKTNAGKGVKEIGSSSTNHNNGGGDDVKNDWAFWSSSNHNKNMQNDASCTQANAQQNSAVATSDKQSGWKAEKNMRFLLQKVLKQSDVGSLGRIVLPKVSDPAHEGSGVSPAGTGYERWDHNPNGGHRHISGMEHALQVLAEQQKPNVSAGEHRSEYVYKRDFVRSNNLQEGDFIVIYSDVKCNKYMIRGVKVRQALTEPKGATASCKMQTMAKGHQKSNGINLNLKAENSGDHRNKVEGKKMVKAPCYSEELDEEILPLGTMVDAA